MSFQQATGDDLSPSRVHGAGPGTGVRTSCENAAPGADMGSYAMVKLDLHDMPIYKSRNYNSK